jgi:hypothetical protein
VWSIAFAIVPEAGVFDYIEDRFNDHGKITYAGAKWQISFWGYARLQDSIVSERAPVELQGIGMNSRKSIRPSANCSCRFSAYERPYPMVRPGNRIGQLDWQSVLD